MKRLLWSLAAFSVVGVLGTTGIVLSQKKTTDPVTNQEVGSNLPAKTELRQAIQLPVSHVILFNSGVAHFTRSGVVEGEARVDLVFQENDINDLLKSMTLSDPNSRGNGTSVTYDSREPIDRTLRSFAINLNNNPTFANILQQAIGQQVEVTLFNNANQPGNLTGKITSIEKQKTVSKEGTTEIEVLNLWCAEGLRAVKLTEIQRLRFSNPIIENDFKRALETLALSHDSTRKAVSLNFNGEGKRRVEVSYVTENPIWKTSYRLALAPDGKPRLQGWAIVENPTDEDWSNVQMALIAGRPISFKMDLYNPLYVPRPTVEPELFASLRPPTYSGGFSQNAMEQARKEKEIRDGKGAPAPAPAAPGGFGGGGGRGLAESAKADRDAVKDIANRLREQMDMGGIQNVADAGKLGDFYQYLVRTPVHLPRQKSAMLPIIDEKIEGKPVSIYNPTVLAKHPLLGLKFKNTTKNNLPQGPITVYDNGSFAGDTRILDVNTGEERLVSYAIDLGTEIATKTGKNTETITKVKAVRGVIQTTTLVHEEKTYDIVNRSDTDRVLLIEHPNRKGQGFEFVGDNKPVEEVSNVFRFEVPVAAKKSLTYTVKEERTVNSSVQISNNPDQTIRLFLSMKEAPESLKMKLTEAMRLKGIWEKTRAEIADSERRIKVLDSEIRRHQESLKVLPKEAPNYQKTLTRLEEHEKELDTINANLKKLQERESNERRAYEQFLENLTAE